MIRVLHIGMSSNLGGIENFIINLYRNIDKTKIQFDFISFSKKELCFQDEIEKNGAKIYKVVSRKKNIYLNYKQIEKIICENNYKIVHFHVNTLSYVTPILICSRLRNVKIIVHSHSKWKSSTIKTLLLHKLNYMRIKNMKTIKCACSDEAGKFCFGKSDFNIINNGIDMERFKYDVNKRNAIRENLNFKNDTIVLGHVGRISKEKNHKFLIDLFYKYQKINNNSRLLLVGDGYLKEQVQKQINELSLNDKVILLGNKTNVQDYYNAMDCFLFPSIFEGLGMVLIEAQINGVKCIASDTVPKVADATGKVEFLPISSGVDIWLQELVKSDFERYDKFNKIIRNGYDIKTTVKSLQKIYLNEI